MSRKRDFEFEIDVRSCTCGLYAERIKQLEAAMKVAIDKLEHIAGYSDCKACQESIGVHEAELANEALTEIQRIKNGSGE